jgi:acetylornithine deacetylase/succinyl-diaminopimelate desuccinylase-like protein
MDTPLFDAMQRAAIRLSPGVQLVPTLMAGATDSRFFRRAGATCYGFSLQSGRIPYDVMASMFHGDDERIDTESLRLTTALWETLATDFLG